MLPLQRGFEDVLGPWSYPRAEIVSGRRDRPQQREKRGRPNSRPNDSSEFWIPVDFLCKQVNPPPPPFLL